MAGARRRFWRDIYARVMAALMVAALWHGASMVRAAAAHDCLPSVAETSHAHRTSHPDPAPSHNPGKPLSCPLANVSAPAMLPPQLAQPAGFSTRMVPLRADTLIAAELDREDPPPRIFS